MLEVVISEYEVMPGSQMEGSGELYLYHPAEESFLVADAKHFTLFQPVVDIHFRSVLTSAFHKMQRYLLDENPLSSDMVTPLYMTEKTLNSGHVDMIKIDACLVAEQVASVLSKAGDNAALVRELRQHSKSLSQQAVLTSSVDSSPTP